MFLHASFAQRAIAAAVAVALSGSRLAAQSAVVPAEDPVGELAQILYVRPIAADGAGPALFRSLFWLHKAAALDLSPEAALRAAYQRANHYPGPALYQDQLLADWHIACQYGLFTPENLSRLQTGAAPVATEGPYVGQPIEARRVSPNRYFSIEGVALAPLNGPLPKDALPVPVRAKPPMVVNLPPRPASTPAARSAYTGPTPAGPYILPRPGNSGHRDMPMPIYATPVPVAQTTDPATAALRAHVLLQDVPFNGLLPMGGKAKLGIAGVTGSEISVSIVGERKVLVKGGNYYGRDVDYPSVDNYKVPKTNPVRLPGLSSDAYLIKDDHVGGAEVRYYYVDTSIDNGTVFRIAKVVGSN